MRRQAENVLKGLKKGVKVNTPYGITRIPIPTASSLIFHKTKRGDDYVHLQAQTNLIEGKITFDEVKFICKKSAEITKIPYESLLISGEKTLTNLSVFFGIMLLPFPLIMGHVGGLTGFILAVVGYVGFLLLLLFLKKLS